MFVAVQQRRTPLAFLEFAERWPKIANESLEHSVRQLERRVVESRQTGIPIEHTPKEDHLTGTVRVVKHVNAETEQPALGLEIASMRSVWMADFKRLLRDNARTITATRWQTVVPAGEEQWVLTDHPTLNIIYEGPGNYEFKAGWGQAKANFFMPLSPRLALLTEIAQRKTGRFDASPNRIPAKLRQVWRGVKSPGLCAVRFRSTGRARRERHEEVSLSPGPSRLELVIAGAFVDDVERR